MNITQRQAALFILAAQCLAGLLIFAQHLFFTSGLVPPAVFLGACLLTVGLFWAYWHGWKQAALMDVVLLALFLGMVLSEPYKTLYAHPAVLLPPALALVLTRPRWIIGSAGITLGLLIIRSGGTGVYASPSFLIFYTVIVASLVLGRLTVETARRRAEAQARDLAGKEQALRDGEERLRFQNTLLECLAEASIDGLMVISPTREWLYFNRRFVEIWEIPDEIAATRSGHATLEYISDKIQEAAEFRARVAYLYDHPEETDQVEVRLKDGRIFERYSAPVTSGSGVYYGRLWTYRDVTRRKALEEQLRQAQKMEAIGRLAGGIAHDFNNLLTVIIGSSTLALDTIEATSPQRHDLEQIRRAGERGAALTRQLLAFSRKQVLQPQVVNLNSLINNLEKMLYRLIGEDIELSTLLEPQVGLVQADPGQIEQVILNLAVNARDAMPQGGKLTIETVNVFLADAYLSDHPGVKPGPYVLLAVSDNGIGMDASVKEHLFEPFFTTKERGKGTGLGLATVHGIVHQSGGFIWVYSEPGQGATFKIYLPCLKIGPEPDRLPRPAPGSLHGTEIILLLEDNEMVREFAGRVLREVGYTVLEAGDGVAALELAVGYSGGPIALLITDVVLPGSLSSREVSRALLARLPDLKVLYMSGYTDNVIVHHGILDEGLAFLQKPLTPGDLLRKVREVLES